MTASDLVARWDRQQGAYIAQRETRFHAMLDIVEQACGHSFTAVDLACGPGSLTERIMVRFPQARVVAVDYDPMLLAVARDHLARFGDRVTFLDADLAGADWSQRLAAVCEGPVHAVVSTTALHWLQPAELVEVYQRARSLLAPGGVLLNGDHFRFDDSTPQIRRWSAHHDEANQRRDFAAGADDWDHWWSLLRADPAFAPLHRERELRFADRQAPPPTTVGFQLAALRQAGFAEAGTVWQLLDDYVVYGAVRRRPAAGR